MVRPNLRVRWPRPPPRVSPPTPVVEMMPDGRHQPEGVRGVVDQRPRWPPPSTTAVASTGSTRTPVIPRQVEDEASVAGPESAAVVAPATDGEVAGRCSRANRTPAITSATSAQRSDQRRRLVDHGVVHGACAVVRLVGRLVERSADLAAQERERIRVELVSPQKIGHAGSPPGEVLAQGVGQDAGSPSSGRDGLATPPALPFERQALRPAATGRSPPPARRLRRTIRGCRRRQRRRPSHSRAEHMPTPYARANADGRPVRGCVTSSRPARRGGQRGGAGAGDAAAVPDDGHHRRGVVRVLERRQLDERLVVGSGPATECTAVTSSASSSDDLDSSPGRRSASIVLPAPGTRSRSEATPGAVTRGRRRASATLSSGTTSRSMPAERAVTAAGSTPRTPRTCPSRPSSPSSTRPARASGGTAPCAVSTAAASARSKPLPRLRSHAGDSASVIRRCGQGWPLFTTAAARGRAPPRAPRPAGR